MSQLLNSTAAARFLGLSRQRVSALARAGRIPIWKVGCINLFSIADLRRFAKLNRPPGRKAKL